MSKLVKIRQGIVIKDSFLSTDSSSGSEKSSIGSSSVRRNEAGEQRRMVDITRDKPIKVTVRVVVPVRDHPKVSETTERLCMEGQSGASVKRLNDKHWCFARHCRVLLKCD
jgi:KH domain-containing RNA-binding signal transduction-associated protein 3